MGGLHAETLVQTEILREVQVFRCSLLLDSRIFAFLRGGVTCPKRARVRNVVCVDNLICPSHLPVLRPVSCIQCSRKVWKIGSKGDDLLPKGIFYLLCIRRIKLATVTTNMRGGTLSLQIPLCFSKTPQRLWGGSLLTAILLSDLSCWTKITAFNVLLSKCYRRQVCTVELGYLGFTKDPWCWHSLYLHCKAIPYLSFHRNCHLFIWPL